MSKIKTKNSKQLARNFRITKLYLLTKFAYLYNLRRLHQILMNSDNNWDKAESMSNIINDIFGGQTTPKDFIYDSNEQADECINITKELKSYEDELYSLGIDPQDVYAFCADVEYNNSAPSFRYNGHFAMCVIGHVRNYNLGLISKEDLINNIDRIKNFQFAPKNIYLVTRRVATQVEEAFMKIFARRAYRNYKKVYEVTKQPQKH